jgi:nicotinamidase/pyrazinamidase
MKALILVDVQNDFLPGGALPVPRGEEIIPVINRLQRLFDIVVATQDWHPPDHGSFAVMHPGANVGDFVQLNGLPQRLWPVHCVQHTAGAAFARNLDMTLVSEIFQKGVDPGIDSYSGFWTTATGVQPGCMTTCKRARSRKFTWPAWLQTTV